MPADTPATMAAYLRRCAPSAGHFGSLFGQIADMLEAAEQRDQRATEALRAIVMVRPANWDDDDDPEQVAAWKLAAEAVRPAAPNSSAQFQPLSPPARKDLP